MSGFCLLLIAVCGAALASGDLQILGGETEKPAVSLNDRAMPTLVFQTSIDIRVPCPTKLIRPPAGHEPPVRTVIAMPAQNGTYPVILFKHGFDLANCFYTQLFEHLASSGYIVVAPQAVTMSASCTKEIMETAEVASWIPKNLAKVLKAVDPTASVAPDVSKLVIAGHSRGGKVAFALALGKVTGIELPNFSALVTLDPVDGTGRNSEAIPQMVEAGCNHTHNKLSIPVLILGAAYGSRNSGPFGGVPPCAPACCAHEGYFNCSSSPIMYHLSAMEYGHLDFLDDSQSWTSIVCQSGNSKSPLRNFSGYLIVSFLQATLEGKNKDLDFILQNWKEVSPKLDEPQIFSDESNSFLNGLDKNAAIGTS